MASATPSERPEGRRTKRSGCCLGLVVVVAIIVVALLQSGRKIAERRMTEAVASAVPADSWSVRVGAGALAKALLGLPFGFQAEGSGVHPRDFPQIREVSITFRDLGLDSGRRNIASGSFEAEAVLEAPALAAFANADPEVQRVVRGLSFKANAPELEVQGTVNVGALVPELASMGTVRVTARGRPAVIDNGAAVGIELAEIKLALPDALSQLGFPSILPTPKELAGPLRDLLRLDLRRALPGVTVQSVTVEPGALRLRGTGTLPPPAA